MKNAYVLFIISLCFYSTQAQIVNIPDANFKNALINTNCVDIDGDGSGGDVDADTNDDGEIQVSEALAVSNLWLNNQSISSLVGIEAFLNLESLECTSNQLTVLDLSFNTNLLSLNCAINDLGTLDLSSNINLNDVLFDFNNNLTSVNLSNTSIIDLVPSSLFLLTDLNLSNCSNLETLEFFEIPLLSNLDVTNCSSLLTINTSQDGESSTSLSSLDLSTCSSLTGLVIRSSPLTSLDLSSNTNLTTLSLPNNPSLTDLNISNTQLNSIPSNLFEQFMGTPFVSIVAQNCNNLTNVTITNVSNPQLESLDVQNCANLSGVSITNGQLNNLEVANCNALNTIYVINNNLTDLDVTACPVLDFLDVSGNQLTTINVSQNSNLTYLVASNLGLIEIDVASNNALENLLVQNNALTEIDVSQNTALQMLVCDFNQLDTIDVSNNPSLMHLDCTNNGLTTLFVKNGSQEMINNFSGNPDIVYICADEFDFPDINLLLDAFGYDDCVLNSYCTFTPGGEFYSVEGNTKIDFDSNGCDTDDLIYPNLKLNITNGIDDGTIISSDNGDYEVIVQSGSHTITPVFENSNYFSISPSTITVDFPTDTSPFQQDFCITPNGIHNDLEVVIIPLEQARPGFETDYKIVYKNKGNTLLSGTVTLDFDDDFMNLLSTSPIADSQGVGVLSWNYTDLLPFESREIQFTMTLNTPTDVNFPLNDGDELGFAATINPVAGDETPLDNSFGLKQTVVNSFDPNDKTCLEGEFITPAMVGEYVHYLIRFENTGSASAINIVVKDIIDTSKFDMTSLIPLNASHDFITRIKNVNEVEFVFENIQLPFDDANNDGYITFKIKTLGTLVEGDTFENDAEIYFDFNAPIITNNEITTVEDRLNISQEELDRLKMFPNPVNDILNIQTTDSIKSVAVYSLSGQLLQQINVIGDTTNKEIDMSSLSAGFYFVKVTSEHEEAVQKIVKE